MEEINVNELCNEAGKMRKFFKVFSQIDEVLVAVQNSDAVLKQLKRECAAKESELAKVKADIHLSEAKLTGSRKSVAEAIVLADTKKREMELDVSAVKGQVDDRIKKAKDAADKEIKEIRAYVQEAHVSSIKLANDLEESKKKAQKVHDAVIDGLKAEELRIEEKIQQGRAALEDLKAKLSV